ncbi:EpsG family protein [Blautia sp. MSJ-9]|uniref:EpsG family protein n=1 Tax=Blautia sp. MSJ-9 TaxID=2841511 RepID=UPI001C114C0B|nr:EpsG family protein [Blautia sp. MSJ-9]MBU5681114.1 EpsG family protein [Blautia sp. MSJ-9]
MAIYLGICGYCFKNPATDPDIVRYINYLRLYQGRNLRDSFNLVYENLFLVDIWFHFIAQTGNFQLLPASAVFIYYFIIFYVLSDYKERFNVETGDFALMLFWVLSASQFAFILNSFRSYVAFAIFFLGVYREEIQGKRNIWNLFLYICPIFLHVSSMLLIVIYAISKIRKKSWTIIATCILFVRGIITILADMAEKINSSNPILKQIKYTLIRADMYFSWEEGGWADQVRNSGYYNVVKIFCLGIVIFSIFVLLKEWIRWKNIGYEMKDDYIVILKSERFCSFGSIFLLITLQTFAMTAPECFRFVFPAIPFLGMLYMESLPEKRFNGDDMVIIRIFMSLSGICGIIINIYNINTMIPITEYFKDIALSGILKF